MSKPPVVGNPVVGNIVTGPAATLRARIVRNGPLPVHDFMAECLYGEGGYYRGRPVIGAAGDFTTAPEISQVFGEMIGLWCVLAWRQMGSPDRIRIVEYGPGRGTLMADLARALRVAPELAAVAQVELVEISEALRTLQEQTLANCAVPVTWSDGLAPAAFDGATLVIGNEFLDAFPIFQAVFEQGRWQMRGIGLDQAGAFAFMPCGTAPDGRLDMTSGTDATEGDIAEWRCWRGWPGSPGLIDQLAGMALQGPLAALFIDYGYCGPKPGDSLQAVRNHQYEHPLAHPGLADLTAHVDFGAFLADCRAIGLATQEPLPQAQFLGGLGVIERARRLMDNAAPRQANAIETGVQRLLAPQGMGGRFLAVGVRSPDLQPIAGLGPDSATQASANPANND